MQCVIEGDNLDTLDTIQDGYYQLVYLDPPYGTLGIYNKYNDKFDDDEHWLSFIEPRLTKAYSKLLPSGVIAISIDDTNQAILKVLCDKLFNRKNFVAQFIWIKSSTKQTTKYIDKKHEYILVYAKNKSKLKLNRKFSNAQDDKRYKYTDEKETFWIMPDNSVRFTDPKLDIKPIEDNMYFDNRPYKASSKLDKMDSGNKEPIEVNKYYIHDLANKSADTGTNIEPIEINNNNNNMAAPAILSTPSQSQLTLNKAPLQPPDGTLIYPRTSWRWCKDRVQWAQQNNLIMYKLNKSGQWTANFKQYRFLTTNKRKRPDGTIEYYFEPLIRSNPYTSVIDNVAIDHTLGKLFGAKNKFHYAKPVDLMK